MIWTVHGLASKCSCKKAWGDEGAQKDLDYKGVVNTRGVRGMDLEPKHSS